MLLGLLVSCTGEPGVGRGASGGDTRPLREHEIGTSAEASAVANVLTALAREANIGAVPRGIGGTATLGNSVISFDDFALRVSGSTMTLAGNLVYRRAADGSFALDGIVDVQWSEIADTITLHDHQLTTSGGLTFAF
jgi:hypothetical protein